MKLHFEENGDLLIDDIPDDMVKEIERRALANGLSTEAELRNTLLRAFVGKREVSE